MQEKSEKRTASARQQKFYHRPGSGGYNYLKKKVGDNYALAAGEAKEPVKGLDKRTAHYLLTRSKEGEEGTYSVSDECLPVVNNAVNNSLILFQFIPLLLSYSYHITIP